jgi:cytochrome c556
MKLESLARSGMTNAFGKQLEVVGATCKACHDSYRQQD